VHSDLYVDSIAVKIRKRATIQTFDRSQTNAIINGIRKTHLLPIYSEILLGKKNGKEDNKHAENLC